MPQYILNRNYVHRSTLGVVSFEKGKPSHVPPMMEKEIMAIGGERADGTTIDPLDPEVIAKVPPSPMERRDDLFAAFQIIAERNRYRTQLNILKNQAEVVIDKRPVRQFEVSAEPSVELLPSLKGIASDNEIKALRFAASDECIERRGWLVTQAGQVKDELGEEVFPRGFMTGLRKLVGEVDSDE